MICWRDGVVADGGISAAWPMNGQGPARRKKQNEVILFMRAVIITQNAGAGKGIEI
jgi:hypothetical protein